MQQFKPWIHHAKPFVVTEQVFTFFAHHLPQPFLDFRVVVVVILNPAFIAGIVEWVNINAFYLAFIFVQQGFEVVAGDDFVAATGIVGRHFAGYFLFSGLLVGVQNINQIFFDEWPIFADEANRLNVVIGLFKIGKIG